MTLKGFLAWFTIMGLFVFTIIHLTPYLAAQGIPFAMGSGNGTVGTSLVTPTETVCATTAGVSTVGARTITLHGYAQITSGAGTTAMTMRLRRGAGIGGANVVTPTAVSDTAGDTKGYGFNQDDSPGEVANQQYTLTAQPTAATAAGTIQTCHLDAIVH